MNIAVLVSGGVDSSVALALLKEQGHTVTAFYLKIWLEDELSYLGSCPWEEDLAYVQKVCSQYNVPLEVISLQKEYWDAVVAYTLEEIKAGRTPNPDILCNERIKFGAFYMVIGNTFDKVATGHYAQLEQRDREVVLKTTKDPIKDQTYFLSHLKQEQLRRALFPIGHLCKAEVRELASKFNLATFNRKDSQGICFLGKLKFNEFIKHYFGEREGTLIEYETGKILGSHKGYWYYTIGQRQGLGLADGPWYVVKKDIDSNTVFISRMYYASDKARDSFYLTACNWITQPPTTGNLKVKVRHGAKMYQCTLIPKEADVYQVLLAEHDQGLAEGQFAALYDGDVCLGSGIITNTFENQ